MTLSMPRQIASVPLLRHILDVVLRHRDLTARCRTEFAVLISEASANAVSHGHGDQPIETRIDVTDQQRVIDGRGRVLAGCRRAGRSHDGLNAGYRDAPRWGTGLAEHPATVDNRGDWLAGPCTLTKRTTDCSLRLQHSRSGRAFAIDAPWHVPQLATDDLGARYGAGRPPPLLC